MLRWYLASLIFLLIISPGIGFGVYQYVMHHPAEPGSFVGRAYERTVKAKLLVLCTKSMASYVQPGKTNTEEQTKTCHPASLMKWSSRMRPSTARRASSRRAASGRA